MTDSASHAAERARALIRDVPNFPKPGSLFRDITPLLAAPADLADVLTEMARPFVATGVSAVVGIESRGFLFGLPIAQLLGLPFVLARKPGKLPRPVVTESFALEYGTDTLSIHADAFGPGDRVLVVDDVLATGGTAEAACKLVQRLGATVAGVCVVSELAFLDGRTRLAGYPVHALVSYDV
jgi:adenine phosphoribosyltransferase